ncbi:serine/threonine protein kinase [Myxococcota bacterium]|nr:serine/threonine protein kinase [Myxococcota bacterium]MBU1382036.1 serine/threonine protein kinase [Myxococcota bacterium]MBU1495322.1 serine/threonine protein kinase [Myxococcota bacterium]
MTRDNDNNNLETGKKGPVNSEPRPEGSMDNSIHSSSTSIINEKPLLKTSANIEERVPTVETAGITTSSENRISREGPLSGSLFEGKYKVGELIGEGGMGQVYKATHVMMKKTVALKILQSVLSSQIDIVERFRREAESAGKLRNPHIINVLDFGRNSDGIFYLVMEFVEGIPLSNYLFEGPMDWRRACRIMMQILTALEEAHKNGIIHRDLKPDNIMISTEEGGEEFVKILDFGIAKLAEGEERGMQVTRAGMIFGTPSYISPEQAKGQSVTGSSDIYSAGIIFFQMVTGKLPFTANSTIDLINKHIKEPPPSPRSLRPDLPPDIEILILRALAKKPKDRPKNAFEMKAIIGNALHLTKFIETQSIGVSGKVSDFFVSTFGKVVMSISTISILAGLFYFMFLKDSPEDSKNTTDTDKKIITKPIEQVKTDNPKTDIDVIELLIKKDKLTEALSIADEDIKKNPGNKKAIENLQKVRKLFVEKAKKTVLVELAAINEPILLDQYIVKLKKWLDWLPTDGDLNYFLAMAYSQQKNHSKAINHLSKSLLLKPTLKNQKEIKAFIGKYIRDKHQWIRSLIVKVIKESYGGANVGDLAFLIPIINDNKIDVDERYEIYKFALLRGISSGIDERGFWEYQLKWSTSCKVRQESCKWFENHGIRTDVKFLQKEFKVKYFKTGGGVRVNANCYRKELTSAIVAAGKRKTPPMKSEPVMN